jgi:hypothetical protein
MLSIPLNHQVCGDIWRIACSEYLSRGISIILAWKLQIHTQSSILLHLVRLIMVVLNYFWPRIHPSIVLGLVSLFLQLFFFFINFLKCSTNFRFIFDSNDSSSRGRLLLKVMGPMVGRILKIPCKFQMGQSQGQERRRSRKQCKDWCNPLEPSLQIYRARPQHSRWTWKKKNQL